LQLLVLLVRFCFTIVLALYSCLSFVRERGLCPWCCCMVLLFVVCRCVCSDFVGFVSWSCCVDLAVFAFVICQVFLCGWVFLCVLVLCYVMPCLLFKFRVVVFGKKTRSDATSTKHRHTLKKQIKRVFIWFSWTKKIRERQKQENLEH
jgi:hypothetical protein